MDDIYSTCINIFNNFIFKQKLRCIGFELCDYIFLRSKSNIFYVKKISDILVVRITFDNFCVKIMITAGKQIIKTIIFDEDDEVHSEEYFTNIIIDIFKGISTELDIINL